MLLVFSTKLPPRQTSTGVSDLTIHEPEAGYGCRMGCMAARDEYCDNLSRIALNAQETGGRIEFCLRIFAFFEILELPIWERSVDAIVRVSDQWQCASSVRRAASLGFSIAQAAVRQKGGGNLVEKTNILCKPVKHSLLFHLKTLPL
jgi:hypothetical protein